MRNRHEDFDLSHRDAAEMLSLWLRRPAVLRTMRRLHGGACSAVYSLEFDRPPHAAVAKIYPSPDDDYARERRVTQYACEKARSLASRVHHEDSSRGRLPFAFILLERLPGVNLADARLSPEDAREVEVQLADALLALHAHRREQFGEILPGAPGGDGDSPRWADIMLAKIREFRQDMEPLLPPDLLRRLDAALSGAEAAFADQGPPTLVHGDIWATNIMVAARDGRWALSGLVDWVSARYADVEYELAYLEAWQTVGAAFFERYTRDNPLRPGYERRRLYYWLATYMLHVWLFRQEQYVQLVDRTVERLVVGA